MSRSWAGATHTHAGRSMHRRESGASRACETTDSTYDDRPWAEPPLAPPLASAHRARVCPTNSQRATSVTRERCIRCVDHTILGTEARRGVRRLPDATPPGSAPRATFVAAKLVKTNVKSHASRPTSNRTPCGCAVFLVISPISHVCAPCAHAVILSHTQVTGHSQSAYLYRLQRGILVAWRECVLGNI